MAALADLWPFRRSRAAEDARRLLAAVTQISRQPGLYGAERAPDTLEGRLEMMMLHAALALMRLRREPALEPLAQAFTDQLFRQFDAGLREDGVGDMAVPKRMNKIAARFYGRLEAYAGAVEAEDAAGLAEALGRNALAGDGARQGFAATLAGYALDAARAQAGAEHTALFRLDGWRAAPL